MKFIKTKVFLTQANPTQRVGLLQSGPQRVGLVQSGPHYHFIEN